MDQLFAGIPQSPAAVPPVYRDQQSASSTTNAEAGGESFENYVSKAGHQDSRQNGRDRESVEGSAEDATDPQALNSASPSTEGALKSVADSSENRIRLALLKHSQKGATTEAGKDGEAEKTLAKMIAAAKQIVQKVAAETTDGAGAALDAAASPSEELSMLLGLVPSKESGASAGKKTAADGEEADDTEENSEIVGDKKSEILMQAVSENTQAAKATNAAHSKDDPASEAVRVVSADGKGRPVDISLARADADGVTDTDKQSSKSDTATVIEARRYLGFSQDSNAQTLTGAIKSDSTWTEALAHVDRARLSLEGDTVKEVNTLKLQMNPGDLGNMVASLKLKGDELSVVVRVDTIEAYRHLSADQDDIVKALQDQGFSIDKVSVQLNPSARPEDSADRDLGRQDQSQKGDQGNQPSDRNQNARQGDQTPWTRDEDVRLSTAADGRVDSPRAGDIYL